MPLILNNQLGNNLEIEATIDGRQFVDWLNIKYTAEANKARSISFSIAGLESLERCRLGGIVRVEIGRGGQTHNLTFEGVIQQIQPSVAVSSVTAVDFVTQLSNSEIVRYTEEDVVGNDLYFLAADAANYKSVDTSQLLEGSGLMVTSDASNTISPVAEEESDIDVETYDFSCDVSKVVSVSFQAIDKSDDFSDSAIQIYGLASFTSAGVPVLDNAPEFDHYKYVTEKSSDLSIA